MAGFHKLYTQHNNTFKWLLIMYDYSNKIILVEIKSKLFNFHYGI